MLDTGNYIIEGAWKPMIIKVYENRIQYSIGDKLKLRMPGGEEKGS